MKDLMSRVKSFIMFDFPFNPDYIGAKFISIHYTYKKDIPLWSTNATRQKIIASYWFKHVPSHFSILFSFPAFILLMTNSDLTITYLSVVFVAAFVSLPILFLFTYLPVFFYQFVPQLETVKETYERRQLEQVEKCRQAQLSNFSLSLFAYVLERTNNLQTIQPDDKTATLLMRFYGVDAGSIKKNLEMIFMPAKRKNLSERKITEIRNRFSETLAFMEDLQFAAGIKELKKLETQFFKR